jgi:hypothetical protein
MLIVVVITLRRVREFCTQWIKSGFGTHVSSDSVRHWVWQRSWDITGNEQIEF